MTRRTAPSLLRTIALTTVVAATAAACATTSSSNDGSGVSTPTEGAAAASDRGGDRGTTDGGVEPAPLRDASAGEDTDDDAGADAPSPSADPSGADLDVGPIGITAGDDATVEVLDDGRTVVQGDLAVPTAAGDIELADADIAVGVGPDGEPTIAGTARVPFPTEGVFADAEINRLPLGEMGSAFGRDLAHLGAHLHDDTRYLFFAFDGGIDVDLPFAGQEGFEAVPSKIAVPAGVSAAMVFDPSDPYFYVGTDCPDLSNDDEQPDDDRQSDDREDDDRDDDDRDDDDRDADSDERSEAYHTLEPSNLPTGQECGIGISINGNIPAPATAAGDAFTGHVVVDGIVPLFAGIELDGSAVISLRDPGARTVGWGTVLATVPLIDSIVDIQIPLMDAAVEIQAEGTRIGVAYAGSAGTENPTYELPLIGVPITLPASASMEWDARFGFIKETGGSWRIDADSYAELSGEFGLGLGAFGELIGLELSDVASQSGTIRIDATGVSASGEAQLQIHPALHSGAASQFALRVDAADWTQSRLDFAADVTLGGYTVAAADVSVGASGLAIAGEVDLGFARTAMTGEISAGGFELTGIASVDVSLDGLAEASRSASSWLQDRIDEVKRLDDDIERARQEVRENRRNRDAAFSSAKQFLQNAIDGLDELDAETARNNAEISDLQRKIRDDKDWYDGLSTGQKVVKWAGHAARLAAWGSDIGLRETRNFAIDDVYRPAAVGVLTGAQEALELVQAGLDALPVDTNPKVAGLLVARGTAVAALELAQGTVELFEIEGSLRGEVQVRIASDGVGGSFSGELCGPDNCTALPGGSILLGAETEICVELPGLGQKCLRL